MLCLSLIMICTLFFSAFSANNENLKKVAIAGIIVLFGVLVLAVFESAELTNEDGYLRVENSAVFYTPANELSENKKQYLLLNNNFESAMIPIKITDLTSEQDAIVSISRSGNSLIHKIIFFPFHKKIVYNPYRSIKIRELRIDKQKYKNGTYDELISALPKGAD